jgi:hypothetical protein
VVVKAPGRTVTMAEPILDCTEEAPPSKGMPFRGSGLIISFQIEVKGFLS